MKQKLSQNKPLARGSL